MHDDESPDFGLTDPELTAFEARLASLAPHSQIDRDRLMFAAGRRSTGRRLRVVNRVLAGTSLALAGVACLSLFSPEPGAPAANPQTNLASQKSDASPLRPTPTKPFSVDQGNELSVALFEGPTNQRLLREWEQNGQSFDRPVDQSPDDPAVPRNDIEPTSPSTSRELLLQYLQSTSERL